MQDQIVVLNALLRFDFSVCIQPLLCHVFVRDEVANVADEIIHALAHLLKDHRQFLLICRRLKGFQLGNAFDQFCHRQIDVWMCIRVVRFCLRLPFSALALCGDVPSAPPSLLASASNFSTGQGRE